MEHESKRALAHTGAEATERTAPTEELRSVLRGVGQVVFQGHAGTGILFLIGIAITSRILLIGAMLGALIGYASARLLRYDHKEICQGLFGFNSTLVGIAVPFYLNPREWLTWVLVVVGAALAAVLTRFLRHHIPWPTYTAAFILTAWFVIAIAHGLDGTAIDHKPEPPGSSRVPHGFLDALLAGEAEIMFGSSTWTGLAFFLGIGLSNRKHALLTLLGTVVGTSLALYHNDPEETVRIGIYGYNAALAAAGIYLWRSSLLLPILAAAVSVPITEFFPKVAGLPPLTAPFVLACWALMAVASLERPFDHIPQPKHA
jgi:urea transporter